jgi:hypothetical protein
MEYELTSNTEPISVSTTPISMESPESKASAVRCRIGHRFAFQGKTIINAGKRFHRVSYESPDQSMKVLADDFEKNTICEFTRLVANRQKYFLLTMPVEYDFLMTKGAGWLFRSRLPERPNYWLPLQPMARTYDKLGRILSEETLPIVKIDIMRNESCALFRVPKNYDYIEYVVWTLPSNSDLFEELHSLSPWELQSIFLWGSHTQYSGPKDLYDYVIHGVLYENRWSAPKYKWKAFAEVDAFSLFNTLNAFCKTTGKKIYDHLKTQVVFSVIFHQDSDGAWRQGLHTDILEEHYRYQCSAIHMLSADYEQTKDVFVLSALKKAVEYLGSQCEALNIGTWYLHDSLERNPDTIRNSPLPFLESRALGKSTSNMLVLNTHLDALVALSRYEDVSNRFDLEKAKISGIKAVIAILGLRPAEVLYRILFKAIELTFVPISRVRKLSLQNRVIRKLAVLMLVPLLPRVKKFFPRLVMPTGYIDRDLSVRHLAHVYHAINVMDILRFHRRYNITMVDAIIEPAVDFAIRSKLVEKWFEDEKYPLGFWSEAMYLECIRRPERSRKILADVVIALSDSNQGLPPSLLGCNPEYIPLESQVPCMRVGNDGIVIVNLSTGPNYIEFLLINATNSPQKTEIPRAANKWVIRNGRDEIISAEGTLIVPSRDWIRLRLQRNDFI